MTFKEFRAYAMGKPGAIEDFPFGPEVAVYEVAGKMFASARNPDDPARINLKCDPDRALMLRDVFDAVQPGYHMNKRHWNTVTLDGTIDDADVEHFIDHSYELVVAGLTKAVREKL